MRFWVGSILIILVVQTAMAAEPQVMQGLMLESMKTDSTKIFAATTDSIVVDSVAALIVKAGKLHFANLKSNQLAKPMSLPAECARVALAVRNGRAARDILCFGKKSGSDDGLLVYSGNGKFTPLLKTPKKIFAAGGNSDRLFFVSGDGLFQMRPRDGIRPVFASALMTGVRSLAFDSENDVIYLASNKEVMSLRGGVLDVLVQGLGGSLSLIDKDLALVSTDGRVFRLVGLDKILVKK